MKKCPYCAEEIMDEATVCRYCGRSLLPNPINLVPVEVEQKPTGFWWVVLALFIPLGGWIAGGIFMGRADTKSRGKTLLIVATISFIVSCLVTYVSNMP